jgi:hypothetical protein
MPEDGIQRRRHPRYPCDVAVTVYVDSTIIQARIPQISRGGCLIFPPLPAHKSPEIKLSMAFEDGLPPANCKGEIVYTIAARGSGVAFTEISIYNQDRISSFFAKPSSAEKPAGSP